MKYLIITNRRKVKQFLVTVIALIFTVGIVYTEKDNISVFSNLDEDDVIYSVETNKKQIALTFDISWGDTRQEPILNVLENNGLKGKATFFLSAPWSETHFEIVNRISKSGYEIGNHGNSYTNYSNLTDDEIINEIINADNILYKVTGDKPKLLRTPNGDIDNRITNIAKNLGYTVIQWDTDSKDWLNPGVDNIVSQVLNNVHPGDIILMHASDSCKQTHEALPIIINILKNDGYQFLTVSQLISSSNIELSEID